MTGAIAIALMGAASGVGGATFPIPDLSSYASGEGNARAWFQLLRDGSAIVGASPGSVSNVGEWISPAHAEVGDQYWARVTVQGGSINDSLDANTIYQLNASRAWGVVVSSPGSHSCYCTLQIATDSGMSNIVAEVSGIVLSAEAA